MDISSIIVLVGFVGICFLAATTGAMFRPADWYEQLRKPAWRPPNWVFPPAWTFLYTAAITQANAIHRPPNVITEGLRQSR